MKWLPQALDDPIDTTPKPKALEDRLPPEILDRIIGMLAQERVPDKANYSALCALQ